MSDEDKRDQSDAKDRIWSRMTPDPVSRVTDFIVEKIEQLVEGYESLNNPDGENGLPVITSLGLDQTKRIKENRMLSTEELRRIAI